MHTRFDAPLPTLSTPSAELADPSAPVPSAAPVPSPAAELPSTLPFQRLDCYQVALSLARLVHSARIGDAELRDQATRAAKSAFLNLCEGLPSDQPGVRRRYFRQADGSVHEVAGALDLANAIGALDGARAREGIALAARLRALLRGLLR